MFRLRPAIGLSAIAIIFPISISNATQQAHESYYGIVKSVPLGKPPDNYVVQPSVKTALGARTMALDPKSGRLFLVTADISINPDAAATDYHHRFKIAPGSVKLLFLDPTP